MEALEKRDERRAAGFLPPSSTCFSCCSLSTTTAFSSSPLVRISASSFPFFAVRVHEFRGGAEVRSPRRSTNDARRPLLLAAPTAAWNAMQILYESVTPRPRPVPLRIRSFDRLGRIVECQMATFAAKEACIESLYALPEPYGMEYGIWKCRSSLASPLPRVR